MATAALPRTNTARRSVIIVDSFIYYIINLTSLDYCFFFFRCDYSLGKTRGGFTLPPHIHTHTHHTLPVRQHIFSVLFSVHRRSLVKPKISYETISNFQHTNLTRMNLVKSRGKFVRISRTLDTG